VHSIRGGKNLAVARDLWLARDAYAQDVDTAPGRLVPDSALLAAARVLPETKRQLSALKEFSGRASRTQIDRWWDAIQTGQASTDIPASRVASDALPPPRVWSDKNPEADLRLKAARAVMSVHSEELSIPIENLLTPDYLRRVSWTPPSDITPQSVAEALESLGARQWQIDVSAQSIAEAFVEASQTPEESDEAES
jgi:ribonuclease D